MGHCFQDTKVIHRRFPGIAAGLRALRPCRNKPGAKQGGINYLFFPKWCSDTSCVTWLKLSLFYSEGFVLESVQRTQDMVRSKMLITLRRNSRWNLSTAEFGRRINLSKGIEVMLQAPSDPLALNRSWFMLGSSGCQDRPGTRKLRNSCEKPKSSSAHRHYPDQVQQVRQIRV